MTSKFDAKGVLESLIEEEKAELLEKLEQAADKARIEEELAACELLLKRLREIRDLPPQPLSEKERLVFDKIVEILDRLPAAYRLGITIARAPPQAHTAARGDCDRSLRCIAVF
jgi:hypothetical protein